MCHEYHYSFTILESCVFFWGWVGVAVYGVNLITFLSYPELDGKTAVNWSGWL